MTEHSLNERLQHCVEQLGENNRILSESIRTLDQLRAERHPTDTIAQEIAAEMLNDPAYRARIQHILKGTAANTAAATREDMSDKLDALFTSIERQVTILIWLAAINLFLTGAIVALVFWR